MTLTLTPEELIDLTHRTRPKAQLRALRAMGIEARQRPDGSVAVLRTAVEASMGGATPNRNTIRKTEPDWEALDALIKKRTS